MTQATLARAPETLPEPEGPPTPPAAPAPKHNRLRALDGLRLLAALMVCLYHYSGRGGQVTHMWGESPRNLFPDLSAVAAYGSLGVQVFFVISGFVICMSSWGRTLG